MRIVACFLMCVLAVTISGCASRHSDSGCSAGDGIAQLVEVADGNVTVPGFRFGDAVVTRMDSSMLELAPLASGGRIRILTSGPQESGAESTSLVAAERTNPMVLTASAVTMYWLSTSSVEISFKEPTSRDSTGTTMQHDALKIVIDI